MANPQKENGYTAIANEILDKLIKYRLPGEQRQVLDFVIRKTYGYNKKRDAISLSQFEEATCMARSSVIRARDSLVTKRLLLVSNQKVTSSAKVYEFNKDFDEWEVVTKRLPSYKKVTEGSYKKVNQVVTKRLHTKDNITKDKYKDKGIYSRVVNYLNEKTGKHFKSTSKKTKNHIRARLNDGFSEQDFMKVIDNRCAKWMPDKKFREYLRPETLFGTKFESYLNDMSHPLDNKFSQITIENIQSFQKWRPPNER
jgi:phage replication O-like protein O